MTTTSTALALSLADGWQNFWRGDIGVWILERGVTIALFLIGGLLAARFINWAANRVVRHLDAEYRESDQLVRSESTKHRQAVASVVSWVSVALLFVVVAVQVSDILAIPVGSLVAPAAVLGAALGFGAQRIVQDLLAGFFIITEKQYGFGDLVQLSITGVAKDALGTVEDVTLRVTKLRSAEGEMFTIPNGQIVKSLVFLGAQSGKPYLLLVSGKNRVNEKGVAVHLGEGLKRPDATKVRDLTGYAIGGIPPFGHDIPLATYMDADLLAYDIVWAAAGTPRTVFSVDPKKLQAATGAEIITVT